MSTILFAWELGGGLGHLLQFAPLARALARSGHRIAFALKDLRLVRPLLGTLPLELWQAPQWLGGGRRDLRPVNYAELLMQFGYLDPHGLAGVVEAWRNLYRQVRPDLIVVNHAPTALLAASGLPIARAIVDMGFGLPPKRSPLPPMRWWAPVDQARLVRSEARVVATINALARAFRFPPRASLAALFDAELRFLCTFPELDHYPGREAGAAYAGPLFTADAGRLPRWPSGTGPRLFAYLDLPAEISACALAAFAALDCRTLIYAPCVARDLGFRITGGRIALVGEPVHVGRVLADADAVICHGSGLSAAALLAGKPVLLVARHLEQYLVGLRIRQLGAGALLPADEIATGFASAVHDLLAVEDRAAAARRFAARHATFSAAAQLADLHARCEAVLGRAAGTAVGS